jgi:hypothetical protein
MISDYMARIVKSLILIKSTSIKQGRTLKVTSAITLEAEEDEDDDEDYSNENDRIQFPAILKHLK